jgi:hypothetical protein
LKRSGVSSTAFCTELFCDLRAINGSFNYETNEL